MCFEYMKCAHGHFEGVIGSEMKMCSQVENKNKKGDINVEIQKTIQFVLFLCLHYKENKNKTMEKIKKHCWRHEIFIKKCINKYNVAFRIV